MRKLIWILVIILLVVHQDFWLRDDRSLVFGFMPVGLAYHAMFSIAAACVWALAVKYAWPHRIEQWAHDDKEESSS